MNVVLGAQYSTPPWLLFDDDQTIDTVGVFNRLRGPWGAHSMGRVVVRLCRKPSRAVIGTRSYLIPQTRGWLQLKAMNMARVVSRSAYVSTVSV